MMRKEILVSVLIAFVLSAGIVTADDYTFLAYGDQVDTMHYLCGDITLNSTANIQVKAAFKYFNDVAPRNFMVSLDCPEIKDSLTSTTNCTTGKCKSGMYCWMGRGELNQNFTYEFVSLSAGNHKVCVWNDCPHIVNSVNKRWQVNLYYKLAGQAATTAATSAATSAATTAATTVTPTTVPPQANVLQQIIDSIIRFFSALFRR